MRKLCFNAKGEEIEAPVNPACELLISWAKAFDEIYCHHAYLKLPFDANNNDLDEVAKVSLKIRLNIIENGEISSHWDKTISRFLPVKKEEDNIIVPIDSIDILDGLCENGWTTLKGGKRGAPKSFPLSISVTFEKNKDSDNTDFPFLHTEGKFPYTICEQFFNDLQNSQKIDISIFLT